MSKPALIKKLEVALRELDRESNFSELTDAQRYYVRHLGHKIRDKCNGALFRKPNPGNYEPKQSYTEAQIKSAVELAGRLGVPINNPYLWLEALTLRSYPKRHPGTRNNQRLEFLGDAVLEIIVTEYLFKKYPYADEHAFEVLRDDLVGTKYLTRGAKKAELKRFLLSNYAEMESDKCLCDAFEAVVAAIYLDAGLEAAVHFVEPYLFSDLPETIGDEPVHLRSAEVFNNQAEAVYGFMPTYKVIKEDARMEHGLRGVTIGVYLGDELIASATSNKEATAKIRAAHRALLQKGWLKYLAIEDAKITADGNAKEKKKKICDNAGNYKPKCEREGQDSKGA